MKTTMTINKFGSKIWVNEKRQIHRENGPAVIHPNGHKEWYLNGVLHREDGPARISPDGTEEWYLNGKLHREDGPAYSNSYGYKQYWLQGNYYECYTDTQWKSIVVKIN